MFSLFKKANASEKIKDLTFNELIKIIKNHPEKDFIESIRQKRREEDLSYKTDKRELLSFTPNCSVNLAREFSNGGFSKNFKAGSGYIYIDIDDVGDAVSYKKEFIKKYSDVVSLVAVSSSLGGLFILIKVNHLISSIEDFSLVWEYFNANVFSGKVDDRTKDFNRTNFITSDPDVYVNYENEFDVSFILDNKKERIIKNTEPKKGIIQDLITPFTNKSHTIPFNSSGLLLHTHIDFNKDEFVKLEVIENFIECRIFYHIIDTKKRPTFTKIIIGLLQLNGENNIGAMFNYMKWINDNRTTLPMRHEKLVELFESVKKDWIKGLLGFEGDMKLIHFNPSYTNCKKAKDSYKGELIGLVRKMRTKRLVDNGIKELREKNIKPTQMNVASYIKKSIATVKRYWNENAIELNDIQSKVNQINKDFKSNRSQFYDSGVFIKGYDSSLDLIIDEETGEVLKNEILNIDSRYETIPATDNTQKETGADNEEKNRIYAEHYNQKEEWQIEFKEINRILDEDSTVALQIMSNKYRSKKERLEKIRA